jgi:carbon-monoxide dehydrogenase medium subunit
MKPFELLEPPSLAQAAGLLATGDASDRAAGGCTALMLMMKAGVLEPRRLVSLRRIEPRYFAIEREGETLRVGSQVTLTRLAQSPVVRQALPVLAATLRTLANVRVRNVATVGGALAHADPHMDLPPLLAALDARVVIQGPATTRELAVDALVLGYMETALAPGELIAEVRIPLAHARHAAYRKITTRSADDWPALGIAVALTLEADASVSAARVFVSAAVDRPTRLASVEALLAGARLDAATLARAGDAAAAEARPIADQHGSAAYKRELLRVHLGRTLAAAAGHTQRARA